MSVYALWLSHFVTICCKLAELSTQRLTFKTTTDQTRQLNALGMGLWCVEYVVMSRNLMRNESVTAQSPTDNSAHQPQAVCGGLAHAGTPQQHDLHTHNQNGTIAKNVWLVEKCGS